MGKNAQAAFRLAREKKGKMGYLYAPFISDIPWTAYCDKNQAGKPIPKEFGGEGEVLSPAELPALYPDALVCVTSDDYFDEIKHDLMSLGIKEENILPYCPIRTKVFEDEQYFDRQIMEPRTESYFIDGGCYRLDTVERFLQWNGGKGVEGIISFEPDPINHQICCERLAQLSLAPALKQNCRVIHGGLGEQSAKLRFASCGNDESSFSAQGEIEVPLVSIDETVANRPVSFIKLDVEGFELSALKGAAKTITRCRPRMAICAYHRKEDLVEIPKFLLGLGMDYKLYLRMYSNEYLEIVVYAV